MGALSPTHWAIIIVLVLLLFGSRKLPDMARGLGQSLRIFKAETSELRKDSKDGDEKPASSSAQSSTPAVESGQGSTESAGSTGTTGTASTERASDSR